MKPREWQRLNSNQQEILEKHLQECPVRVGQLAKEFGIKVKVSDLRTGISGQIKREDNDYVIRVNRYEARERQRFTIAHELAHFLLHRRLIDDSSDGITDNVLYRSGEAENVEYEANRLAAEIIMPATRIVKALHEDFDGILTEETITSLAERFQVSKAAVEIRLSKFSKQ